MLSTEWERLYVMQIKKPTKKDDGRREVMYNRSTGEFKLRKKTGEYRIHDYAMSPIMIKFEDETSK